MSLNTSGFRPNKTANFLLLTALTVGLALLAGCATTGIQRDEWTVRIGQLKPGLSRDEVRNLFGEPEEVRPADAGADQASVWVYRQRVLVSSSQKITGSENRIYVDPITGQERSVPQPVYTSYNEYTDEQLRLNWISDELVDWKRMGRSESDFQ